MHIKTNIETNGVHLAILAVCPLLMFINTIPNAIFYLIVTAVCFLASTALCLLLNKYIGKTIKIFVTAMVSTVIVTIINVVLDKVNLFGLHASEVLYFTVLSAVILSIEVYYISTKALVGNYFIKLLLSLSAFAAILLIFSIPREILGNGTFFGKAIAGFTAIDFFATIAFDLLWLGLIGAFAELIYHTFTKWYGARKIAYQKFVKLVRNEKEFQYDSLRRQKLLVSPVDIKYVDGEEIKTITDKSNENEVATIETEEEEEQEEAPVKKKHKKFKFSRETKEEKVYDQTKKGVDKK